MVQWISKNFVQTINPEGLNNFRLYKKMEQKILNHFAKCNMKVKK
jgi:hypothetical protein